MIIARCMYRSGVWSLVSILRFIINFEMFVLLIARPLREVKVGALKPYSVNHTGRMTVVVPTGL